MNPQVATAFGAGEVFQCGDVPEGDEYPVRAGGEGGRPHQVQSVFPCILAKTGEIPSKPLLQDCQSPLKIGVLLRVGKVMGKQAQHCRRIRPGAWLTVRWQEGRGEVPDEATFTGRKDCCPVLSQGPG